MATASIQELGNKNKSELQTFWLVDRGWHANWWSLSGPTGPLPLVCNATCAHFQNLFGEHDGKIRQASCTRRLLSLPTACFMCAFGEWWSSSLDTKNPIIYIFYIYIWIHSTSWLTEILTKHWPNIVKWANMIFPRAVFALWVFFWLHNTQETYQNEAALK